MFAPNPQTRPSGSFPSVWHFLVSLIETSTSREFDGTCQENSSNSQYVGVIISNHILGNVWKKQRMWLTLYMPTEGGIYAGSSAVVTVWRCPNGCGERGANGCVCSVYSIPIGNQAWSLVGGLSRSGVGWVQNISTLYIVSDILRSIGKSPAYAGMVVERYVYRHYVNARLCQ